MSMITGLLETPGKKKCAELISERICETQGTAAPAGCLGREDLYWDVGFRVQGMERKFLSGKITTKAIFELLRRAFWLCGDQQHFLSHAACKRARGVVAAGAREFSLRVEGFAAHHVHEASQRRRRSPTMWNHADKHELVMVLFIIKSQIST